MLHLFHFFIRKIGGILDGDLLLFTGSLVFGRDIENSIGINIKGNFDLRDATRSGGNTIEDERSKSLVVCGHRTLTLKNVDLYLRLVIGGGGEGLRFAGRNGSVAFYQRSHDGAHGFDTKSERGDIKKKDIFDVAGNDSALNSCTEGNCFIRINRFVGFFAEEFFDNLLNLGHAGHSTNEDYFCQLRFFNLGVGKCLLARFYCFLDKISYQFLKLGSGQFHGEVKGLAIGLGDERLIDLCFGRG